MALHQLDGVVGVGIEFIKLSHSSLGAIHVEDDAVAVEMPSAVRRDPLAGVMHFETRLVRTSLGGINSARINPERGDLFDAGVFESLEADSKEIRRTKSEGWANV